MHASPEEDFAKEILNAMMVCIAMGMKLVMPRLARLQVVHMAVTKMLMHAALSAAARKRKNV